jgi:Na+/melibiose symporter-like transporter
MTLELVWNNPVVRFIAVAVAVAIVDCFWTLYMRYVGEKKPMHAAISSVMIILLGAFTTVNYIHDHVLIIAAMIGAFFGTLIPMTLFKTKQ